MAKSPPDPAGSPRYRSVSVVVVCDDSPERFQWEKVSYGKSPSRRPPPSLLALSLGEEELSRE